MVYKLPVLVGIRGFLLVDVMINWCTGKQSSRANFLEHHFFWGGGGFSAGLSNSTLGLYAGSITTLGSPLPEY